MVYFYSKLFFSVSTLYSGHDTYALHACRYVFPRLVTRVIFERLSNTITDYIFISTVCAALFGNSP